MASTEEQEQTTAGLATTQQPAPQQLQKAAPEPKAPVRIGIAPATLEDCWRLAQMMAKSELLPKNFRGKPEDVLVAIQMGVEIGLPPMQALQSIGVINGRPSLFGDGFLAVIMASAAYADHDEYYEVGGQRRDGLVAEDLKQDSTCAVCTFARRGKATPVTRRFTVGQAKKAGLLGKAGPWTEYPDRMLSMRARSWAGRDGFPDVLRGISTSEEAMDAPPDIDVQPLPEVRRISEGPKPAAVVAVPKEEEVMLDPALVLGVEQFAGGFTIRLSTGVNVDTIEMDDAAELEKFVGTKNKVRLTVTKADTTLNLKSFAIAD